MEKLTLFYQKYIIPVLQSITVNNMRSILNISLPASLAVEVKKEVKEGKFASTSEFFRHLLRMWNTEKLLMDLKQSKKEIAQGKGMVLKSFKDLR